jgi:hypothetical protein
LTLLLLIPLLNQDMRAQSDSILTDSTSLENPKTVRHWGFSLGGGPGWVIAMDKYVKMWLKDRFMYTVNAEVQHHTYPSDNDDFAADYNYPTISLGLRYGNYASTTMHKTLPGPWGTAEPVDYHSRLGNSLTAYLTFARPFFRTRHWEADYTMGTGIGYSNHPYNKRFNIDNELIGSRWLIYFVAGVHATYKISPHWGVKAGAEFAHLSNGALNRPNKGSNAVTVKPACHTMALRLDVVPEITATRTHHHSQVLLAVMQRIRCQHHFLVMRHTLPDVYGIQGLAHGYEPKAKGQKPKCYSSLHL